MVVARKDVCRQEKEGVRCLKKIVERDHQKALIKHERLFDQHTSSVRSICRRADISKNTGAAVAERLPDVYARCSNPDRQMDKRPERSRKWVRRESEAL